jgi:hypothetical protein
MTSTSVTEIRFELVVNGKRKRMLFFSPDKIDGLLESGATLGGFLRDMRDTTIATEAVRDDKPRPE